MTESNNIIKKDDTLNHELKGGLGRLKFENPPHRLTLLDSIKGGSRTSLAKKRALLFTNFRKRKCVNCPYLDVCYVGHAQVGHRNYAQSNNSDRKKELKLHLNEDKLKGALNAKCQLPPWTLNMVSHIQTTPDFNDIEKMMFSRLIISMEVPTNSNEKDFFKLYKTSELFMKSMLKNKISFNLHKSEEKREIIVRFVKDDTTANNSAGDTDTLESP